MLKKYSNRLIDVIAQSGFDVNDFRKLEFKTSLGSSIIQLVYKNSPLWFQIHPAKDSSFDTFSTSCVKFAPTFAVLVNNSEIGFEALKSTLIEWLKGDVKPYVEDQEEPDYWKLIENNPIRPDSIDFNANEPFTESEKIQLKIGFAEVRRLLTENFELSTPQLEATNRKLDYLIEATERLNKTDWKGIAIATMFTIASELALDEQKRAVFFGLFHKIWAIAQHLPDIIH